MKVLCTGNLGYLGPLVVELLQKDGHVVHGVDTGMYLHQLAEPLTPDMLPQRQYFGDIRDYPGGKGYDTVVHLAGLSNDPMGDLDPQETDAVNTMGTLAMMAKYRDAHHVFASSASVYGASDEVVSVGSPTAPQTAYARSKLAVEEELRQFYRKFTILRLGTLFGWAPNFRTDLVVNRMCWDAVNERRVTYNHAWRPLLHVAEAAKAFAAAVEFGPRGTKDIVQVSMQVARIAGLVFRNSPNFIDVEESPIVDTRDYRLEATVTPSPDHAIEATVKDLMKRRLPYNIRLDAYKEAR